MTGTEFADELDGSNGLDLVYGYAGDDFIFAGGGHDTIFAGAGDNTVQGSDSGAALVFGGAGNDLLRDGDDTLHGGDGSDTFIFRAGDGDDIINDFIAVEDVLRFAPGTTLTVSNNGTDTTVDYGPDSVSLLGVVLSVPTSRLSSSEQAAITYRGLSDGWSFDPLNLKNTIRRWKHANHAQARGHWRCKLARRRWTIHL